MLQEDDNSSDEELLRLEGETERLLSVISTQRQQMMSVSAGLAYTHDSSRASSRESSPQPDSGAPDRQQCVLSYKWVFGGALVCVLHVCGTCEPQGPLPRPPHPFGTYGTDPQSTTPITLLTAEIGFGSPLHHPERRERPLYMRASQGL